MNAASLNIIRDQIQRLNNNINAMLHKLNDWALPLEGHPTMRNVGRLVEAVRAMVVEFGMYSFANNKGDGSDTGNLE